MEKPEPDTRAKPEVALNPWVSTLAIPLAILIAGQSITSSIEASKLDSEYVKIALGVISADVAKLGDSGGEFKLAPASEEQLAMRRWAIRLLNRKAPEKLTDTEQTALLRLRKPPPPVDLGNAFEKLAEVNRNSRIDKFVPMMSNIDLKTSRGMALDWQSPFGPLNLSGAAPLNGSAEGKRVDRLVAMRFTFGTTF